VAIERGVAYSIAGASPRTFGAVVLTNDDWNEHMREVGIVPLYLEDPGLPTPTFSFTARRQLWAAPGRLVAAHKEILEAGLMDLPEDAMASIEDGLCDLLALPQLCAELPTAPESSFSRVDYPRWSEIYYAGEPVGDERKRYVVVSHNLWNSATQEAIAVRTTSQQRRYGAEFPAIQGGAARACCAQATHIPARAFALSAYRRPPARSLSLHDMSSIARGIVQSHQLQAALKRRTG
jgi:mRNA-degrading endonuclease toxin of MazEF toxin-antitoxin module